MESHISRDLGHQKSHVGMDLKMTRFLLNQV